MFSGSSDDELDKEAPNIPEVKQISWCLSRVSAPEPTDYTPLFEFRSSTQSKQNPFFHFQLARLRNILISGYLNAIMRQSQDVFISQII